MREFGSKHSFLIGYDFASDRPDERQSPYLCSEGWLRIHAGGVNVCELDRIPPPPWDRFGRTDLYDHLFPYADWLVRSAPDFLRDSPLPIEVHANSAAGWYDTVEHRLRNTVELEQAEFIHETLYDYFQQHCLAAGTDGGHPPPVFFRRTGERMELSWNSEGVTAFRGQCRYRNGTGRIDIPVLEFSETLRGFVSQFLMDLSSRCPDLREDSDVRKALADAQRIVA